MQNAIKIIATSALLVSALPVFSQNAPAADPRNVVQLSASGAVEVQQDELILTLGASADGRDASSVQAQLRQVVDAALTVARSQVAAPQMEVRTGQFSLYPRHGKNGEITGWQGRAELVLQGRDFARITGTAGKIQSMAISQIAFDLSREARSKVESEAQAKAIEAFKMRATEMARSFGFTGYTLREVSVNSNEMAPGPRPRLMAAEARMGAPSDAPVPVEAGKAQVVVNVSGSVQMR